MSRNDRSEAEFNEAQGCPHLGTVKEKVAQWLAETEVHFSLEIFVNGRLLTVNSNTSAWFRLCMSSSSSSIFLTFWDGVTVVIRGVVLFHCEQER
jgi:hypothetical protein